MPSKRMKFASLYNVVKRMHEEKKYSEEHVINVAEKFLARVAGNLKLFKNLSDDEKIDVYLALKKDLSQEIARHVLTKSKKRRIEDFHNYLIKLEKGLKNALSFINFIKSKKVKHGVQCYAFANLELLKYFLKEFPKRDIMSNYLDAMQYLKTFSMRVMNNSKPPKSYIRDIKEAYEGLYDRLLRELADFLQDDEIISLSRSLVIMKKLLTKDFNNISSDELAEFSLNIGKAMANIELIVNSAIRRRSYF